MRRLIYSVIALSVAATVSIAALPLFAQTGGNSPGGKLLRGNAAFGDWRNDKPGTRRLIRPQDLPPPGESPSVSNFVRVVRRSDQKPVVPPGFEVNLFASDLAGPRTLRTAPNGDIFVAESRAGRISVLRPNAGKAAKPAVFASGLHYPFGIAFYPPGPDPQWVYIG
ncbi:MAG: sorbosone dehydrogenase family protein, partial [Xanthobacteraceae bacterium]